MIAWRKTRFISPTNPPYASHYLVLLSHKYINAMTVNGLQVIQNFRLLVRKCEWVRVYLSRAHRGRCKHFWEDCDHFFTIAFPNCRYLSKFRQLLIGASSPIANYFWTTRGNVFLWFSSRNGSHQLKGAICLHDPFWSCTQRNQYDSGKAFGACRSAT